MSRKAIEAHDIRTVLADHGEPFTVDDGTADGRTVTALFAGPSRITDVAGGQVLNYDPQISLAAADAVGIARGHGITRDEEGESFEVSAHPRKEGGWVHLTLKES